MDWVEVSLKVRADRAPAVAAVLAQACESTAAIEQEPDSAECTVKAYLAQGRTTQKRIEQIREKLSALDSRYPEALAEKAINRDDWFAPIRETFTTLEVGQTLRIRASWVTGAAKDKRHTIQIDPGYAFGTGLHPTTHMCLIELERLAAPGMTVLDLGTGSGILAIAAARLGATDILALDTDVNAVYAAAQNVKNNEVHDAVQVRRGTLSLARQRSERSRYDLVVANIVAPVISGLAARFWQVLKPGGILIASGITEAGLDEVLISFALAGLTLVRIDQDGDWHMVVARKLQTAYQEEGNMKRAELAELIKGRRSIRAWDKKPVAQELLLEAVELATYAPNGGNQQNWKFYVILNKSIINAIADAVQESANYAGTWPEMAKLGEMALRMTQRASFFREAPAAIAVASAQYQSPVDQALATRALGDPRATEMREWRNTANSRIQSVASAIAYLLLVIHQMGLGAVWMTGPLQAKGEIEKILKVPPELDLVAFIPVGYPAESPALRERKPVKDVCQVIN